MHESRYEGVGGGRGRIGVAEVLGEQGRLEHDPASAAMVERPHDPGRLELGERCLAVPVAETPTDDLGVVVPGDGDLRENGQFGRCAAGEMIDDQPAQRRCPEVPFRGPDPGPSRRSPTTAAS